MAIITQCPECGKKLKAAEAQIGKKAKCPQCQKPFEIKAVAGGEQTVAAAPAPQQAAPAPRPTPAAAPQRPAPAGTAASAVQPREEWFLQTADGEEYGPVSRAELNEWLAEGRIDNECQLLREGWEEWKWADQVFPDLAGGDGGAAAGGAENPFAGLGEEQPAAAAPDPFTGIAPDAASNPYAAGVPSIAAAQSSIGGGGGGITHGMKVAMRQTKPWVMLFMILAGIACIFPLLMMLLSILTILVDPISGIITFMVMALYVGLYGYNAFLLFKYFDALGKFERVADAMNLEKALVAQKNFWKFCGIMVLIAIGVTLLMFVAMLVLGAGMAAMMSNAGK